MSGTFFSILFSFIMFSFVVIVIPAGEPRKTGTGISLLCEKFACIYSLSMFFSFTERLVLVSSLCSDQSCLARVGYPKCSMYSLRPLQ